MWFGKKLWRTKYWLVSENKTYSVPFAFTFLLKNSLWNFSIWLNFHLIKKLLQRFFTKFFEKKTVKVAKYAWIASQHCTQADFPLKPHHIFFVSIANVTVWFPVGCCCLAVEMVAVETFLHLKVGKQFFSNKDEIRIK